MSVAHIFLSHLSGDEVNYPPFAKFLIFLSHLSGDEVGRSPSGLSATFLSHLSGDEATFYTRLSPKSVSKSPER